MKDARAREEEQRALMDAASVAFTALEERKARMEEEKAQAA